MMLTISLSKMEHSVEISCDNAQLSAHHDIVMSCVFLVLLAITRLVSSLNVYLCIMP